jgi:porin
MVGKITYKILIATILIFINLQSYAQEEKGEPRLGSADQNENREDFDDSVKYSVWDFHFLQPYFDFKTKLQKKTGLRFDIDYNALYIGSTADKGEGMAASGVFRFYGSWDLVGRNSKNKGTFIYKLEHRHKYTTIPVIDLSMDMGNVGIYGVTFNDNKFRVTNLYWKQKLVQGRLILLAGFFDATDFFDIYGLGSPWVHFNNLNFSTGLSVAALPGDGYLGFTAGGWLSKHIYAIAGFGDQNSDPTMIFRGFDTFFSRHEYFKHFEIGATSAKEYVFLDNVHLSLWHRDNNRETGTGWGWGAVFSITKYINKKWLPFFRASYTEKGESLLEAAISTGLGYQHHPDGHQFGIGFSWGRPNADTFGPGLRDQYLLEAFWRIQLSKRIAFTPGLMYTIHPALNTQQDAIFLWSIRSRIAL